MATVGIAFNETSFTESNLGYIRDFDKKKESKRIFIVAEELTVRVLHLFETMTAFGPGS